MNPLLDSAGLWLRTIAALSWKGALLALIVGLAILLMRRRVSPAWRHGLWLLVLVRLAVPDVATSPWSMSRWVAVPRPMESPSTSIAAPLPSDSPEVSLPQTEAIALSISAEELVTPTPTPDSIPWTSWQWLTFVWLLGASVVIGVMVVLHLRMRHRVRRDQTEPSPTALASLREACALAHVKRMPTLILTDAVRAPALFGIVRPAILLPREFAGSCDPASLNLILLHELAHLQRRDLWAQVAAALIIALHWFNPVVWWAGRRLRAEAEMAADARALRYTDASEAHRMGEVLLGFAHHAAAGWMVWFASATVLGISQNKRDLRHRIEALMDLAHGRRTWWLMGLAAFVALSVTGLTKAPAEEAKKTPAEEVRKAVPLVAKTKAVTGIVVDDEGRPIPGATCYLMMHIGKGPSGIGTTTDAKGRFRFETAPDATGLVMSGRRGDYVEKTGTLPEGTDWKLSARHPDYLEMAQPTPTFKIAEGKDHRITLNRPDAWLSGRVTRKANGQPVANATVYAGQDWLSEPLRDTMLRVFVNSTARMAITDAAGRYRIPNWSLKPKKCLIMINAPGAALLVARFSWDSGDLTLDQTLEADPSVQGRIVNAEGQPVVGAEVHLEKRFSMLMDRTPVLAAGINRDVADEHSIGRPLTGADGVFERKPFNPPDADKLWLTARHPYEGYRRVRLRDWKTGDALKLDRWSVVQGRLLDAEGNVVRGAELKLLRYEMERDETDQRTLSVSKTSSCKTDEQGRYRLDQILPGSGNSFVVVDGKALGMRLGPHLPGETKEFDISLAPKDAPLPQKPLQSRKVTGRVILPSSFPAVSDSYEIGVLVGLLGNRGATRLNPPGADGRFESSAIEPGNYLLRIWLEPKDKKLSPVIEEGVSMIFKLEADAKRQALDLGEFKLDAADFSFRPASQRMAEQAARKKESDQRINSPVAGGAKFTTWTGGGGRGVGPEEKVSADGQIAGTTKANYERFIIRGTKADGSHHFTTAQVTMADPDAIFEKELTFTPAAMVEGKMNSLPVDYEGDGWVVASVIVQGDAKPRVAIKGAIPNQYWFAWAPVQRDGKFRFAALPHGSLTLTGIGNGWSTRGTYEYNSDVLVNLMGTEPVTKLSVATMPTFEKRVRLLRPDGNPAVGAAITVTRNSMPLRNTALVTRSHDVAPEDAGAYERYKNTTIQGHRAVADAEGNAILGNQPRGTTTCEVKWIDPKTKVAHVEKVDLKIGSSEALVVKLTGKNE